MATVIVCDGGCGAQSPDPKSHLHEANHWLRVRSGTNVDFELFGEYDDKLFCKSCAVRVTKALAVLKAEGA